MKKTIQQFNNSTIKSRGFSIIELLIATSLFVIIIAMSVTIFLRALKTQKSALLLMESNDNVALAIEGMAREIRVGTNFQTDVNGNSLEFMEVGLGNSIKYVFSNGYLLKGVKSQADSDFNYQRITSEGVEVKNFMVNLDNSPNYPPKVTLIISISPKNDALKNVTSNIQTTISSRQF